MNERRVAHFYGRVGEYVALTREAERLAERIEALERQRSGADGRPVLRWRLDRMRAGLRRERDGVLARRSLVANTTGEE